MALSRRQFVAYAPASGLALDVGDIAVSPPSAGASDAPDPPGLLAGQALTSPTSAQRSFVAADLSATTAAWKICVVHRPPYSSTTSTSSSQPVLTNLVPLLDQYGVTLCLSGNSHNYERSHPLRMGVIDPTGVTYVVSGGGGNGLNSFQAGQPFWSAYRAARFEYVQCSVSPTRLVLSAYSDTGQLFDSTTWTR
ncbi:hypothetical protein [Streptomyces sp. NPDC056194]|uniref:hypothetical protein n=1 Tax=unclassified Streptomyces TaxID=2593676 RepID=UPI0035E17CFA